MKRNFRLIILLILLFTTLTPTGIYAAKESESIKVIPGGEPFGIKLFSEGVMVTKIEGFNKNGDLLSPAETAGIKINDIIICADDKKISTNADFKEIVESSEGKEIKLKIKRGDKELTTIIKPMENEDGVYKIGMWIKDSAAGLGTITFYREDNMSFCGLGHGICEAQTGNIMPLSYGDIESAYITSVTTSKNGNVGTLNGYFTGELIGEATNNNETGVYGRLVSNTLNKKEMEIAGIEEITKGKAYILTTVNGNEAESYEVEITKIKKNDSLINMVIEITDEELLSVTGGIVQGMSGSPIIQNGKIVGALTHVLVDDVTKGYAIFAKTMYENTNIQR